MSYTVSGNPNLQAVCLLLDAVEEFLAEQERDLPLVEEQGQVLTDDVNLITA